jgi:transcriptional regulator with XRE-family HTH domain
MAPADEVVRLARLLRAKVGEAGLTLRQVSAGLGHYSDYLSAALGGRPPLKLKVVLGALAAIRLPPEFFFGELYGLAPWLPRGRVAREASPAGSQPVASGEPGLADLFAAAFEAERRRPIDPQAELKRLAQLLRERVREAGSNLRRVSRAMGLAPDHLGQLLNGYVDFQAIQLHQALAVLGVAPADFFADLYQVPGFDRAATVPGQVPWSRVLTLARALVAEVEKAGGEPLAESTRGGEVKGRRR